MLFVVTHTHTPELCPIDDLRPVEAMVSETHASQSGVKVLGSYICGPEHTLYFALEAEELAQILRFLRPMMKIGTAHISPVQTLAEAMGVVKGG